MNNGTKFLVQIQNKIFAVIIFHFIAKIGNLGGADTSKLLQGVLWELCVAMVGQDNFQVPL